jgi:hypothetical protein
VRARSLYVGRGSGTAQTPRMSLGVGCVRGVDLTFGSRLRYVSIVCHWSVHYYVAFAILKLVAHYAQLFQ